MPVRAKKSSEERPRACALDDVELMGDSSTRSEAAQKSRGRPKPYPGGHAGHRGWDAYGLREVGIVAPGQMILGRCGFDSRPRGHQHSTETMGK